MSPEIPPRLASVLEPSRRGFLRATGLVAAGLLLPLLPGRSLAAEPGKPKALPASTDEPAAALAATEKSPLVYVSPLQSNGLESRCHGEVWFVTDGRDVLVVTEPGRWRAACIGKGLDRARLWVGDFGPWRSSNGSFRKAPSYVATASLEADGGVHERALKAYGRKYADAWDDWEPRFREGLASGDRVMIRYSPAD